jgi:hypothetical protein
MSNGRIEIPLDEYKGMKEKIESLEKALASKNDELTIVKNQKMILLDEIEDFTSLSLYERVFRWKSSIQEIFEELDEYQ